MTADITQAQRFVALIAGDGGATFQTFDESGKRQLAHILQGTLAQHHRRLQALNVQGAGIFVTVNESTGKGRCNANIIRVRALFLDTDGAAYPAHLPLKPHIVVQSSPGRWHLYFLVDGVALEDFGVIQAALAEKYGTDSTITDLCRVMRLPGFYHRKGHPVQVQLLETRDALPYTSAQVSAAWPETAERIEQKKALKLELEKERADILKRAAERKAKPNAVKDDRGRAEKLLQAHHDNVAASALGSRHGVLLKAARALGGYIASGIFERLEVADVLKAAASVCGLPEREAADVIRWGLEKGADVPLSFNEQGRFSENTCSLKDSPSVTQKNDLMNNNTRQIETAWASDKNAWASDKNAWASDKSWR
jgi:hypothetical protein